jgi:hypothetical protein
MSLTIERQIAFSCERRGRKVMVDRQSVAPQPAVPRLARLMALAIRCQDLIRRRAVGNYTDLAHLGHVSRQRMAQIMALNNLAPDLQERLLFLTREEARGVREKPVLRAAALPSWGAQRAAGIW